ncbi:ABC transporter substrate-binding protein [Paenibacillus allorhizosphaerae]|uniref:Extracellular solute-binding protein n=1 Tax=Paenibacillus allorhizosphaerae TaxID=2849866 RepID=A0ABM8VDP8_9BACL|nr:extracellular solute-binding protein [Paenibacillus allorhizosphaerae]CAG7628295.1 hypothetical protein PAECIP111802_01442 [Paenibacillus allorhizosphaerae]
MKAFYSDALQLCRCRKRKLALLPLSIGLSLLVLSACSSNEGEGTGVPNSPAPSNEPLTLSVYQYSAKMTDEEFQELVVKPVKLKYPHITLELVREGKGSAPQDLVAADSMPDIIYTGSAGAATIVNLNAALDLNDLIKRTNLDPGKFDPTAIQFIKGYIPNGQMLALPYSLNFSALYYNKDIFDKFGLGYPKDGMMWDEAIELTKKVTRETDGTKFKGLDIDGGYQRFGEQLSLPIVDSKSLRAKLQTDGWKTVLEMYKRIKEIPGNTDEKAAVASFEQDRNLAMLAGLGARLGELEELHNLGKPMNWDMAAMPTFAETPNNAFGISLFLLMVSSKSKHPQEAFQVVKLLLEEPSQIALNKRGRLTSLKDPQLRPYFGEGLNSFKGKNKEAVNKKVPAPLPPITLYDNIARNELNKAVARTVNENVNANTTLREAEEKANQLIETEKK